MGARHRRQRSLSARWRWWRYTGSVHLPLHRLHASRLLDDIIDELGGLFILHLVFTNSSLGEQLPQIRVEVVGIPADMTNMLKSTGCPDVCFGDFGALLPFLLILLSFADQGWGSSR